MRKQRTEKMLSDYTTYLLANLKNSGDLVEYPTRSEIAEMKKSFLENWHNQEFFRECEIRRLKK